MLNGPLGQRALESSSNDLLVTRLGSMAFTDGYLRRRTSRSCPYQSFRKLSWSRSRKHGCHLSMAHSASVHACFWEYVAEYVVEYMALRYRLGMEKDRKSLTQGVVFLRSPEKRRWDRTLLNRGHLGKVLCSARTARCCRPERQPIFAAPS